MQILTVTRLCAKYLHIIIASYPWLPGSKDNIIESVRQCGLGEEQQRRSVLLASREKCQKKVWCCDLGCDCCFELCWGIFYFCPLLKISNSLTFFLDYNVQYLDLTKIDLIEYAESLQIIIMTKFYYPQFCLVMIQINIQKFLGFWIFSMTQPLMANFQALLQICLQKESKTTK